MFGPKQRTRHQRRHLFPKGERSRSGPERSPLGISGPQQQLSLKLKPTPQQTRLVLSPDGPGTSLHGALRTHTGRRTQERLGVFIGHLSCYRVISEYRLFRHLSSPTVKHTCVHPKSNTEENRPFFKTESWCLFN